MVSGAKRHFGRIKALDGIDFTVEPGQFVGLIGPNGAGKSTLIGSILGLVRLEAGTASLFGHPPGAIEGKAKVGYLPEFFFAPDFMTPRSYLEEVGRLHGIGPAEVRRRSTPLLEKMGLKEHWDRPAGKLSKGLLRRLGIVRSLFHGPELLIYDEPAWGLDPLGRKALAQILDEARDSGRSLLLCSHNMELVEQVCDRFVFVDKGKVVGEASPESLRAGGSATVVVSAAAEPKATESARNLGGGHWEFRVAEARREELISDLIAQGAKILRVEESRTELIDWVLSRVGKESPDG
ncbi:ABC transporter ATP-binding protein [bacterium]|nr:ABC transporter ATP-binding protein [bacterium]